MAPAGSSFPSSASSSSTLWSARLAWREDKHLGFKEKQNDQAFASGNHVDCSDGGARWQPLPLSSQLQSDRTGWKNHRLRIDRAEFHERRLFSWAALRHHG